MFASMCVHDPRVHGRCQHAYGGDVGSQSASQTGHSQQAMDCRGNHSREAERMISISTECAAQQCVQLH
jgi:hypothetical protein